MVECYVDIVKAAGSIPASRTMLEIKENEILANHSTLKIGGPAKYFAAAKSKDDLKEAINFAKNLPAQAGKNVPLLVIGGGSNILFKDKGFDGMIVQVQDLGFKVQDSSIVAGAGISFGKTIMDSINNNLSGLEWGVGIPGTVGGCVAGNCGAYGHSISEFVESISVLSEEGEEKVYSNEECGFGYRESRFKGAKSGEIILEVKLKLAEGDKGKSMELIKEVALSRKGSNPRHPSAGCVFKNIIIDELENKDEFLKLIPQEKIKGGKFPAGWLMRECGLFGKEMGGAKIWDDHCNYIINAGGAKADDVLGLIALCKAKVKEKFNIDLGEEIVVI